MGMALPRASLGLADAFGRLSVGARAAAGTGEVGSLSSSSDDAVHLISPAAHGTVVRDAGLHRMSADVKDQTLLSIVCVPHAGHPAALA